MNTSPPIRVRPESPVQAPPPPREAPPTPEAPPQVASLEPVKDKLPWGLFPLGSRRRRKGFQIVIRQSGLNAVYQHGLETPDAEVCGVLVGGAYRDDHGEYVHVRHIIRGEHAPATAGSVTFTSETWTELHEKLETTYPDDRILGWYHTHPDHGIFLSGMDMFIQESFFNLPWQIAYVHDPVRLQDGMFRWKGESVKQTRFYVEADVRPVGELNPDFESERERKLLVWFVAAMITLAIFSVAMVWATTAPQIDPAAATVNALHGGAIQ